MICPACDGKRWVDSQYKGPSKCPVCNGEGSIDDTPKTDPGAKKYNQDKFWVDLVRSTMSFNDSLASSICELSNSEPIEAIVHLITREMAVPVGGAIMRHMILSMAGSGSNEPLSRNHLLSRGYVLDDDGKIVTVDDIPVGKFYMSIKHWSKSNDHLFFGEDPVKIDPNRKGNPFFMDDNKAAIGVTCKDLSSLRESIRALDETTGGSIARVGFYQIA